MSWQGGANREVIVVMQGRTGSWEGCGQGWTEGPTSHMCLLGLWLTSTSHHFHMHLPYNQWQAYLRKDVSERLQAEELLILHRIPRVPVPVELPCRRAKRKAGQLPSWRPRTTALDITS